MIKKASYSIFDILGFNARFYFHDLNIDPGGSSDLTRFLRSFKMAAVSHSLSRHRFWASAPCPIQFPSLRSRLFLPEALPGWDLHPFLFLCRGFMPLYFRLLGCSILRVHGRLSRPFPQVWSTAHYSLWGCLAALIPGALNTSGPRQFHLPTKSPCQLVSK